MFVSIISVQKHSCTIGVPQGSCLGPLLYILYTNDINYLMKDFNPILFADVTTIVHVAENSTILSLELNVILYKILISVILTVWL